MKTFCQFAEALYSPEKKDWNDPANWEYKQWVTPEGEVEETDDHADWALENEILDWDYNPNSDRSIDKWFGQLYALGYVRISDVAVCGILNDKTIMKAVETAIANAHKLRRTNIEFWEYRNRRYQGGIKIPLDEVGDFLKNPRRYWKSAEKL